MDAAYRAIVWARYRYTTTTSVFAFQVRLESRHVVSTIGLMCAYLHASIRSKPLLPSHGQGLGDGVSGMTAGFVNQFVTHNHQLSSHSRRAVRSGESPLAELSHPDSNFRPTRLP